MSEPIPPPDTGDPLVRPPTPVGVQVGFIAALVGAAVVLHVVFTAGVYGASWAIGLGGDVVALIDDEPVDVDIVEPPEPEPEPEPEEEPADEADEPTEPEPPEPEPKPEPKPEKKAPPPPDPNQEPPPDQPEPKKPPQRIVGLEIESTVEGGDGPSFNVGNTRMGKTERKAVDPRTVEPRTSRPAPPTPRPEPANRVAANIPGSKAVIVKPKRVRKVEPEYPKMLRARDIEGTVVVRVNLSAAGEVTKVDIIAPAKYPEFNEAARAAARKERFRPATRNGRPIPFSLSFSYRFRLND